jgi:hypothetical protein
MTEPLRVGIPVAASAPLSGMSMPILIVMPVAEADDDCELVVDVGDDEHATKNATAVRTAHRANPPVRFMGTSEAPLCTPGEMASLSPLGDSGGPVRGGAARARRNGESMRRFQWTIAATLTAAFFYILALNAAVYELTSPSWLSWHVVLRKSYSVVAFALVGYTFRRALVENGYRRRLVLTCVAGVALYSAAIEVGQFLHGSQEGVGWNAFDTLCGAAGGAIATLDLMRRKAAASR